MRRREFIAGFGGAAVWPFAARAQQPALPVIGFLNAGSPEAYAPYVTSFRRGLREAGYVERENVAIERWASGQYERLAEMAAELVRRPVTAIVVSTPRLAVCQGRDNNDSDHLLHGGRSGAGRLCPEFEPTRR